MRIQSIRLLLVAVAFFCSWLYRAGFPLPSHAEPATLLTQQPTTARHVAQIVAGGDNTCILTDAGSVLCWGSLTQILPAPVEGLSSGVVQIAAGGNHLCAVLSAGGVNCWGNNSLGQLGDGTTTSQSSPVAVVELGSRVVAVAAGENHTCALTDGGEVKCWGGSVGLMPTTVAGLTTGVLAITAGDGHTCALTEQGGVACWGSNAEGQLGNGVACPVCKSDTPVDVIGLTSGVRAIVAGGRRTCALPESGGLMCWGLNTPGRLGAGTNELYHATAVNVTGLDHDVTHSAVASQHICAILANGNVNCWGTNEQQQLGDGTTTEHPTPTAVVGLPGLAIAVAVGQAHSCIVTDSSSVVCWGNSAVLGLPDDEQLTPVTPNDLSRGVYLVTGGRGHTCATTDNGVKCWGGNLFGSVGDGTTIGRVTPTVVANLSDTVKALAGSGYFTCALTTEGKVKCWGLGPLFGTEMISATAPVEITGLGNNLQAVDINAGSGCVVTEAGGVRCWDRNAVHDITGFAGNVRAVALGELHACVLTVQASVQCWGDNRVGQLGNGTVVSSTIPSTVVGLDQGVRAIAANHGPLGNHSCALLENGAVTCWGANYNGQLGDGTLVARPTPVTVSGLDSGVQAIAVAYERSCALLENGGVKCWGLNDHGQLGDGTTTRRTTPVDVVGLGEAAVALGLGDHQTCAVLKSGALKCWGWDEVEQLGDGPHQPLLLPVETLPSYQHLFLPIVNQ